ncbi:hypothetical protein IB286_11470 [Spongiibacter sp. KMU-158]|uniref:Uncharacterized protein n=1 Tax=Spongiibacter pelagi TaxID=2760804 RepID=A0A927C4J2_9GAMM|nr:hypothetical protein [Spongiibacter pelagi]MBD2859626.1 hypothetical protein [Spongiibacter pelagi]
MSEESQFEYLLQWWRRFKRIRTPLLAVLATALLVSSAVNTFDVPLQDILNYFLVCLFGVGVLAGAALVLVFIFKLFSRR